MKRVLVMGCSGAGKSRFAKQLAQSTKLPVVHLDRQYWLPGWVEPDKAAWSATVSELATDPCWIIDGNYGNTLSLRASRADTVIYIDLPRWLCLWRVFLRIISNFGQTRDDMGVGCPEGVDWVFLKYIWNFPANHRPKLMDFVDSFEGEKIILKSSSAVTDYLDLISGKV